MANMDGIRPPRNVVKEVRDVVAPRTRVRAIQRQQAITRARRFGPGAAAPEAKPLERRRRWVEYGQYPLIAIGALAAAYSASIGQWLVLAFGLIVLIGRRNSREPLLAAIGLLVLVPVFQLLHLETFMNNAAIYAYELLVVGVIAALFELKFQKNPQELGE